MDGIIIQARTGSTRLANKILLPFSGEERIIDILLERIKASCPGMPVVVATTVRAQDEVLARVAEEHGVLCFRGSEDDVLGRFIGAAECYGIDRLIRVCSDNPFLQTDTFPAFFREHDRLAGEAPDYLSYGFADGTPVIKSHLGLFSELTTLEALRRAARLTDAKLDHEHVTIYLYTHPAEFRVRLLPLPAALEGRRDLRFTLDTPDDFALLQQLYAEASAPGGGRDYETLLKLVEQHPDYRERMLRNIGLNEK